MADGVLDSERTSTTVSTSQRQLPPGMKESLVKKSADYTGLSTDLQLKLKEIGESFRLNASDQIRAIDKNIDAKSQQTEAIAKKETITNKSANDALSAYSINLNDPDNIIAQNVSTINRTAGERTALVKEISTLKAGADPLNPLGWLMGAIKQIPLINRHNALLMERNDAIKNIEVAQQLATRQTAMQPASLGEAINEKKLADLKAIEAEGLVKKAEISGAAQAKVAQVLIETSQLARQDVAQVYQLADVLGRNVSTSTTSVSMTAEQKEEKDFFKHINVVWQSMGQAPLNKYTFNALPKNIQQNLITATRFDAKDPSAGFRVGANPAEAISTLYVANGQQGLRDMAANAPAAGGFVLGVIDQGNKALKSLQERAASTDPRVAEAAQAKLKGAKSPVEAVMLGIDEFTTQTDRELAGGNFAKLPPTNPYKLNYSYVAGTQQMKENPYAQFVLKKPPNVDMTDHVVLSKAVSDIADNKVPLGQASAQLLEFYAKGSVIQQADTRMHQLGFKELKEYPLIAGAYGRSTSVNMFNQQSIEKYLVSQVAAKKVYETVGAVSPFGLPIATGVNKVQDVVEWGGQKIDALVDDYKQGR